jgi:hypothetical protein
LNFFQKLQFSFPNSSIKDVQATGENPPKEHQALQNIIFLHFFLFLWVSFALDPDPLT